MDLKKLSTTERLVEKHPTEMYSYMNYLSYVLYPPLYIAGPIMTFNDYLWQVRRLFYRRFSVLLRHSLAPAPAACHRPNSVVIFYPIHRYLAHDGDHSTLHVRRSDQGRKGLGGRFSSRDQHDRFLEPHDRMAESK
jgi:hypothetical protein